MNVLVVNFALRGLDPEHYGQHCEHVAPIFADLPGLVSKTWIANPATNTYGGVYVRRDRQSLENYLASGIFKSLGSNPHLANVTTREFSVLDAPTRVTRGAFEALPQPYTSSWPLGDFPGQP